MRSREWLISNDTVPSISATATRCCRFTSGIALPSTMRAPSSGSRTTIFETVSGVSPCSRRNASSASSGRLDRIADREHLDRTFGHVEARAQVLHHLLRPRLGGERQDHVVLAVQHFGDAGEARLHHRGGGHAVARAHAGKVERLLDVVLVPRPAPEAGHLLRAVGQREARAALVEPGQGRRGGGGAERRAGPLGAAVRGPDVVGAERHQEAAAHVVAQHDGAQELCARAAILFGHRQRGRHDGTARVRLGDRLEVVGFVGVREHAIGQRGVDCGGAEVGGQHRRLERAALRTHVADGRDSGRKLGARHHRRQCVQDPVFSVLHHLCREFPVARGHHVARQPSGDVGRTRVHLTLTERRRRDRPRRPPLAAPRRHRRRAATAAGA